MACALRRRADFKDADIKLAFNDEQAVYEGDVWAIAHAMDFGGEAYNLFGGWNREVYHRVIRLLDFDGNSVSLERPMPDLRAILKPRADKTDINISDAGWTKISKICLDMPVVDPFIAMDDLVLGDSHSVAQYTWNKEVQRNDGLTLHGLLERKMIDAVECRNLVVCAGNIDVRHHFGRHEEDPDKFALSLIGPLSEAVDRALKEDRIESFTAVSLYPVEHSGRRVPKTGWYKGEPYFMPQYKRAEAVHAFNSRLLNEFGPLDVVSWPSRWYEMEPRHYADRYMEKPGSVHLSPEFHLWDYEIDRPNLRLSQEYMR